MTAAVRPSVRPPRVCRRAANAENPQPPLSRRVHTEGGRSEAKCADKVIVCGKYTLKNDCYDPLSPSTIDIRYVLETWTK